MRERNWLDVYPYASWGGRDALPAFQEGQTFIPHELLLKDVRACAAHEPSNHRLPARRDMQYNIFHKKVILHAHPWNPVCEHCPRLRLGADAECAGSHGALCPGHDAAPAPAVGAQPDRGDGAPRHRHRRHRRRPHQEAAGPRLRHQGCSGAFPAAKHLWSLLQLPSICTLHHICIIYYIIYPLAPSLRTPRAGAVLADAARGGAGGRLLQDGPVEPVAAQPEVRACRALCLPGLLVLAPGLLVLSDWCIEHARVVLPVPQRPTPC